MIDRCGIPSLSREAADLAARSRDFGGMIERTPQAVARPKSADEVSRIVRWAAKKELRLSARGGGHSQGGQSLTDRGLAVDTVWLNRFERVGPDLVRAQGGTRWGALVDGLRRNRQTPPGPGRHRGSQRGRNAVRRRVRHDVPSARGAGRTGRGNRGGDRNRRSGALFGQPEYRPVQRGEGRPGPVRHHHRRLDPAAEGGKANPAIPAPLHRFRQVRERLRAGSRRRKVRPSAGGNPDP